MLAGEKPLEPGVYRCEKCGHIVEVSEGEELPKCSECAHDIYDLLDRDLRR